MLLTAMLIACNQDRTDPTPTDASPEDTQPTDSAAPTDSGLADTAAPSWSMDPDQLAMLKVLLANLTDDLTDAVDSAITSADPTLLYNVQLYTSNVARAARLLEDAEMIETLAGIYLPAYDGLTEHSDYLFYYWPDADYLSSQPLSTPARMWLDASGVEVILESSQFLYAVAYLINAMLDLPEQTASMESFITAWAPVLIEDHYQRWIFTSTPFQLSGWGCNVGMMSHQTYIDKRLSGEICPDDPSQYSYIAAITDIDTWILAGAAEILAAHQRAPELVPMDDALEADLLTYLASGAQLIESRFETTALVDFSGQPVEGLGLDIGVWRDHPDYAYSAYEGADFPTADDAAADPDGTWDVSHARRFVQVFDTLHRHPELTGSTYFDDAFMEALAAQLIYGAFDGDLTRPLLNNFMDGGNGWYRVSEETGFGYAPYGLTEALVTGGYGFWGVHNSDVNTATDAMLEIFLETVIWDDSGSGRHGAIDGGTWIEEGVSGGALALQDDGYLDIGSDAALASAAGSVEMWVRVDGGTEEDDLVNIYETSYTDFFLIRRAASGGVMLYIEEDDAQILYVISDATLTPQTWHHLVVTQDGSSARIYIDGEESTVTGQNGGAWTGHLSIAGGWIGQGHWNGTRGAIDEVRLYDRALSAAEVAEHRKGTFADDSGLVGWWSFSEAIDTERSAWRSEHYSIDPSPTDSLDLLQLPTRVVYE